MNDRQASLGALLLAGSGAILTASGTAGGRALLAAGALALALVVADSVRRRATGRAA